MIFLAVLMTSPLSKGLFQKAIGESGTVILVGDPQTLPQAEQRGKTRAAHWQVPENPSLRDLRAVPAADILAVEPNYVQDGLRVLPPNLGITVDGYVFRKAPGGVGNVLAGDVLQYGADRVVVATGPYWCADGRGANLRPAHIELAARRPLSRSVVQSYNDFRTVT
jgi:hypothetical protein